MRERDRLTGRGCVHLTRHRDQTLPTFHHTRASPHRNLNWLAAFETMHPKPPFGAPLASQTRNPETARSLRPARPVDASGSAGEEALRRSRRDVLEPLRATEALAACESTSRVSGETPRQVTRTDLPQVASHDCYQNCTSFTPKVNIPANRNIVECVRRDTLNFKYCTCDLAWEGHGAENRKHVETHRQRHPRA